MVKKLPIRPNKCDGSTTKDYCSGTLNNKRMNFSYEMNASEEIVKKICLA